MTPAEFLVFCPSYPSEDEQGRHRTRSTLGCFLIILNGFKVEGESGFIAMKCGSPSLFILPLLLSLRSTDHSLIAI